MTITHKQITPVNLEVHYDDYEEYVASRSNIGEIMQGAAIAEKYFNSNRHEMDQPEKRSFIKNIYHYISMYGNLTNPETKVLFPSPKNIVIFKANSLYTFIDLEKINDKDMPNDYFKLVNQNLEQGGYYICCVETLKSHSKILLNRYPRALSNIISFIDFIVNRVFPRTTVSRKLYMSFTGGKNKVMSWTEVAGRLNAGGFKIIECRDINNITFFVCKKVKAPAFIGSDNSGILIKLKRVGRNGKIIDVYKFRTMHSYAEYIQEYAYKKNGIKNGDKIEEDFRVTRWGRFLRKFWFDEQPMWINLLRGDLKLVGVRPLSEHKLSIYPEDLRIRRLKHKPGLFPPFYADLPNTNEEFFECENKYLDAYENKPLVTDFCYFFKIIYNIIIKRVRSA